MEHNPTDMKERILDRIKAEGVEMRPRLHFTLHVVALVGLSIAVLVISILILNYILFSVRISGHESFLGFGPSGYTLFVRFFPWHLLAMDLGFMLLLEWMLKRFRFGYRIPSAYLFLALLILSLGASIALDRGTPLNDTLFERAEREELPLIGGLYRDADRLPPQGSGACRCRVIALSEEEFIVEDMRDRAILLVDLPDDMSRIRLDNVEVGDILMIAGPRSGTSIQAFGIREVPKHMGQMPQQMPPQPAQQ